MVNLQLHWAVDRVIEPETIATISAAGRHSFCIVYELIRFMLKLGFGLEVNKVVNATTKVMV